LARPGVGDVGLGRLLAGYLLGGGDLLPGDVGQLVNAVEAVAPSRRRIGLLERVAGLLELERRVARHLRIVVGGDEVAARLVQRGGRGRHGAAGGQHHGAGKDCGLEKFGFHLVISFSWGARAQDRFRVIVRAARRLPCSY
jgi:hypothetical protein